MTTVTIISESSIGELSFRELGRYPTTSLAIAAARSRKAGMPGLRGRLTRFGHQELRGRLPNGDTIVIG